MKQVFSFDRRAPFIPPADPCFVIGFNRKLFPRIEGDIYVLGQFRTAEELEHVANEIRSDLDRVVEEARKPFGRAMDE